MNITIRVLSNGFIKMYENGLYVGLFFYSSKDLEYWKNEGYIVIFS